MQISLCESYDAYYDIETKEWLEKGCSDPHCHFCCLRPPKHEDGCCEP